jgi:hypothetical protein
LVRAVHKLRQWGLAIALGPHIRSPFQGEFVECLTQGYDL